MKYNIFAMNKELNELKEQLKISKSLENSNSIKEIETLKNTIKQKDEIISTQLSNINELKSFQKENDELKNIIKGLKDENEMHLKNAQTAELRAMDIVASRGISCDLLPEMKSNPINSIITQYENMPSGKERFEFFKKYEKEILNANKL